MTIVQPDSTLTAIRQKIRRLTTSPSEQTLSTATIDQAINTFYQQDFPYAIKLDQMRNVYTFYTTPNVNRYPIDINFNQGIRAPVYFEGIKGFFYKDRDQFYNMWPRWPTLNQVSPTSVTGIITGITNATPMGVVSAVNTLINNQTVTLNNVNGMTQVNGQTYTISNVTSSTFSISGDTSAFGVYTSGGTFTSSNQSMSFTISQTPFLPLEVTIGGTDMNGNNIAINDDGNGNLFYQVPNPTQPNPTYPSSLPGMLNNNLSNKINGYQTYPGDLIATNVGNVNYTTGQININLANANVTAAPGQQITIWVSQYQPGRPYTMLFWNNFLEIRPVPDNIYKVEVEAYLTPVQFLAITDNPIITQWWQYISYGASMEIQRERQDMEGVENLREGFMRQEGLVLERQGTEEIGQRNVTIFASTQQQQGFNQGFGWPY